MLCAVDFGVHFGGNHQRRLGRSGKRWYTESAVSWSAEKTYGAFSVSCQASPFCLTSRRSAVRARDRPPTKRFSFKSDSHYIAAKNGVTAPGMIQKLIHAVCAVPKFA